MRRGHFLPGRLLFLAAAGPLSAIQVPQTRGEFVDAVSAGTGATAVERLVIEGEIDEVYRALEGKSSACLDVEVRRSGSVGNQMEAAPRTTIRPSVGSGGARPDSPSRSSIGRGASKHRRTPGASL